MEIVPLSSLMAAEVSGVDLRAPLAEDDRRAVFDAFLHYQLLVFKDQKLGKAEQVDFTQQFGTLERHAKRNQGVDEFPLLHVVTNLDADGNIAEVKSTRWHTDKSFRPAPSMATLLHAIDLPPAGGDTCFANMYAAFAALPAERQQQLRPLRVVHSWEHSRDNIGVQLSAEEINDAPPMSHPLVRVHPDTGRPALFLGMHAAYIDGMSFEQGRDLIVELEEHSTQSKFIFRHTWSPGDLLMWDNRCLLHRADTNFETARYARVLHRDLSSWHADARAIGCVATTALTLRSIKAADMIIPPGMLCRLS